MLRITGKLTSKTLIKEGVSEKGKWKVINFSIEKMFGGQKHSIYFTAKGRIAELANKIILKERVDISFIPVSKNYKDKWFTELVAISIDKYIPKSKIRANQYMDIMKDDEFEFKEDLQLNLKINENEL